MNNIQRISFCEERNELILPIIGLTLSESNIFLKNGVRTLIVNKKGEKKYFDFVSRGFNLELCDLFPNFKKILVVKNPYWSVLETYLQRYCYSHSMLRPHFTFRESVIQDIIEVNYPEDLTQFDDFFIIENYKSEYKRIFGLEKNDEVQYSDRFTKKISNYHTSQKTLSDFYDNDIAKIIYEKFNQYFVKFGYDQYSYLDYHSPVDKIHALHGNQTNIFHL
jgi:hypothetical protein